VNFVATIGQSIESVESGWRRYDNLDSHILYHGDGWVDSAAFSPRNGANTKAHTSPSSSTYITFKFVGSKLRLYGAGYSGMNNGNSVSIDGASYNMANWSAGTNNAIFLAFDKSDLAKGEHSIIISYNNSARIYLDAIDIDGYLSHPTITQVTDMDDMQIGECIACRYTAATANTAGTFRELGTCIMPEIPVAGTSTPDGLFYFIKVDKGILIADRVIQTGITWDVLNASRYIEGIVSTYINPTIVSTNIDTSILNTPSYLPNLFVSSLLNIMNFYFKSAPPSLVYVQFEYPESHLLTSIQVFASLNAAGMEPLSNFSIKGSVSGDFADEQLIYSGKYTTLGAWQTFNFLSTKKFKKFRFYADTWNINNGGGGANIEAIIPYFSDYKIRSLSGGNAYLGTDGKASLTNQTLGAHPTNNEYDKYIVNGHLSDNAAWHWNLACWGKDTPASNVKSVTGAVTTSNIYRVYRGYNLLSRADYISSGYSDANIGFRPVLEYIDNEKAKNIWY
jgi:hypothetical protein